MGRRTSALFLDFDNIFGGLLALDRVAALALAQHPGQLVEQLACRDLETGDRRELLVRRAYLNPNGSVIDPELGNDSGRLYLDRFRPYLVRAGFEVIDCPALTTRQKNAADIRIVIDVLAALNAPVRYDEVIIASSDADFTPLLLKLRAEDRRTTIITAGTLAPAYQAVADRYIDEQSLISLLLQPKVEPAAPAVDAAPEDGVGESAEPATAADPVEAIDPVDAAAAEARAHAALATLVEQAPEPLNLAFIGARLHEAAGNETIKATKWFGHKTLTAFVKASNPALGVGATFVWDPARHGVPTEEATSTIGLPPFIADVCAATDMPRLASASWHAAFEGLADYAATHTFNLTEATAWTRDTLTERGTPVGRQALGFIIRGCLYASVRLDEDPPPSAIKLRDAFVASITERARSSGLEPTDAQLTQLLDWLSGLG